MSTDISVMVVPFEKIFSTPNVYECPFFQRSYKWTKKNIDKFVADLYQLQVDDDDSVEHYLGAVVVRPDRDAPIGLQDPIVWTVIDGQQRLATTFLAILTLCEMLHRAGVTTDDPAACERASAYVSKYLMVDPTWPRGREPRVLPTARDYADLIALLAMSPRRAGVADDDRSRLRFSETFIPVHGEIGGPLGKAYATHVPKAIKKSLGADASDPDAIERMLSNLLRRMKVIWVSVPLGADPYEIFHNLNAEGQRLTHGELVKVSVFQRFDKSNVTAAMDSEKAWNSLIEVLGPSNFEAFLFPYALCHDPQAKKRELIPALEAIWRGMRMEPDAIIADLQEHAMLYRLLTDDTVSIGAYVANPRLAERVRSMRASGPPSSTYPYLMLALRRADLDGAYGDDAARLFWSVESFLVRRQFMGIEPTGLHTIFKSLWSWMNDHVTGQTAEGFWARVDENVNIKWVGDADFERAIKEGNLYGRRIQRFVLSEFEQSHFGDISRDALGKMEIDHVAPQKIEGTEWTKVFPDPKVYASLVNTWANLIPLMKSGDASNSAKGRKNWDEVKEILMHSIFQTPKQLCLEPTWDAHAIRRRSERLSEWALRRWPDVPAGNLPAEPKDLATAPTTLASPAQSSADGPTPKPTIEEVLAAGESQTVEFKSTARMNLHTRQTDPGMERVIVKAVCGFLNAEGGSLLIGVNDDGDILGLGDDLSTLGKKNNIDGYELHLRQLLDVNLSVTSAPTVRISFPEVAGAAICWVLVAPSSQPVYAKAAKGSPDGAEEFWVRVGNATKKLHAADLVHYQEEHWA